MCKKRDYNMVLCKQSDLLAFKTYIKIFIYNKSLYLKKINNLIFIKNRFGVFVFE